MGDRITFLGHSTLLLELEGARLLTDPVLRARVLHLRRHGPAPAPDALRGLDGILISHLHGDHFDPPSLRMLDRVTPLVVPRGAGRSARRLGFTHVHEVADGEEVTLGGVPVRAVPADHDERRWPTIGPAARPLGFIAGREHRTYFAGDTDLFDEMREIAREPLEVALLPVWGWGPTIGPGHMDPRRAAQAAALLRPRIAVPIHWGTLYPLGVHRVRPKALARPPRVFEAWAAQLAPAVQVRVLRPGEALDLEALSAPPAASPRAPTR
ncbi:MAG TPA: MBL fold metallo-hydrolase [Solirubrobacteraceae bacterium]|nr:MBL fold metallo-hydrolase [Solirubrobacteraceae bacterium]